MRRKRRVSTRMHGTASRPRVAVHRTNLTIYAQVIDDDARVTLASSDSRRIKKNTNGTKTERAKAVGIALAAVMIEKKITSAIFDRSRFAYNGRVKALAEGIREGGITM